MWSKKFGNYPPFSYQTTTYTPRPVHKRISNKTEFENYLKNSPKPGDWVYFTSINKSSINKFCLQLVLNVKTDFDTVTWDAYSGYPETMEIVGTGPLIHNPEPKQLYPLWRPHVDYTIASKEFIEGLLDVELQDQLLRAIEKFKQSRAATT